jgi:hypothetical protein
MKEKEVKGRNERLKSKEGKGALRVDLGTTNSFGLPPERNKSFALAGESDEN